MTIREAIKMVTQRKPKHTVKWRELQRLPERKLEAMANDGGIQVIYKGEPSFVIRHINEYKKEGC